MAELGAISSDNLKGLILALLSSLFIGASFIIKKKGLIRAAASGHAAGTGGYGYLSEPLWWVGMITIGNDCNLQTFGDCKLPWQLCLQVIVGEAANFIAYAFAPAVLVTPLGALSIIVSAVLADVILKEKLHKLGILGCVMCIVGSVIIVTHAPKEQTISSVEQVWELATQPAFLFYMASVIAIVLVLVIHFAPRYGHTQAMVYVGICSLMGSLTVMSVKALGIAIKLTFEGINQFIYFQTWIFVMVVVTCILTQMNYLNKALDTFNTALVSPMYYVTFTSLTILASVIMFKDWDGQSSVKAVSDICGFLTILSGTILLHTTEDYLESRLSRMSMYSEMSPSLSAHLTVTIPDEEEDQLPPAQIPL